MEFIKVRFITAGEFEVLLWMVRKIEPFWTETMRLSGFDLAQLEDLGVQIIES
jgi:hypothetical protein